MSMDFTCILVLVPHGVAITAISVGSEVTIIAIIVRLLKYLGLQYGIEPNDINLSYP